MIRSEPGRNRRIEAWAELKAAAATRKDSESDGMGRGQGVEREREAEQQQIVALKKSETVETTGLDWKRALQRRHPHTSQSMHSSASRSVNAIASTRTGGAQTAKKFVQSTLKPMEMEELRASQGDSLWSPTFLQDTRLQKDRKYVLASFA